MDPMAQMAERSALRQQDFGNRMAGRQASSDIGLINRYGRDFQDAYRSSDPLMQARTQQANQLAEQAFQDAQMTDLSPEMRRRATQSARETLAATGRSFDNAGIAAEAMSREDYLRDILRQNRQDFQNYNQNAANLNQATRVDPLRLLRGGDEYSQRAYGERAAMFGIPQESVTRINPDAGVNIGMMENANRNNYNASTYGSRMEAKGGMMGGLGSLIGGIGSAIPGIVGAAGKAGQALFGDKGFLMPSGGSSVGAFGDMGE
jgi:predicted outer membrane protein